MKTVRDDGGGFVEVTLRRAAYDRLRSVLRRYTLCEESVEDSCWLAAFLAQLDRRDAEDFGVN